MLQFILNQPDHQYSAMITGFLQKRYSIINCLGITAISIPCMLVLSHLPLGKSQ